MEFPKSFQVKRSSWARGSVGYQVYYGNSLLHGHDAMFYSPGSKCCVGFLAGQMGLADSVITDRATLSEIDEHDLVDCESKLSYAGIYDINDSHLISDTERERQLTEAFASLGVAVEFVD